MPLLVIYRKMTIPQAGRNHTCSPAHHVAAGKETRARPQGPERHRVGERLEQGVEDERPVDGVALEPHLLLESVKALGLRLLPNRAQAIIHKSIRILNKEIIE